MNLLYLTFGNNATIHSQTAFSIYSFLAQATAVSSVNIITDNGDFYKHLSPKATIIQVTQTELNEWKGKHQFFWRIKIKAIEKICHLYPNEPVLYLDTDTFLFGDIHVINNSLTKGKALMHENEGALSVKKTKTQKNMWLQIAGKSFGNVAMQPTDCMWNAGVVGIPNTKNGKECELALAICDDMCSKGITRYFIEQYSLSLALEKMYGLSEAKSVIVHYWSVKEIWNKQITDFFMAAYFAQWDYEKMIMEIKCFDATAIPFFQRIKNTNLRLKGVIDKLFSNKNVQYLPKK
jgi:hypothetical protein